MTVYFRSALISSALLPSPIIQEAGNVFTRGRRPIVSDSRCRSCSWRRRTRSSNSPDWARRAAPLATAKSAASEPTAALCGKRHAVKIATVGVEVFEIDEEALVVDKVRPGVPCRDMQFDHPVARNPEGDDIREARPRLVGEIARRRDTDQPFLAAERAEALGDLAVSRDAGEAEPDMRQMHDPQARLAIAENQLRLARRVLGIVMDGADPLPAGAQRRDDLAVGRERLRGQFPDIEH